MENGTEKTRICKNNGCTNIVTGRRKFCSDICRNHYHLPRKGLGSGNHDNGGFKITCKICNKTVIKPRKSAKYCGKECAYEAEQQRRRNKEHKCICGEKFSGTTSFSRLWCDKCLAKIKAKNASIARGYNPNRGSKLLNLDNFLTLD